MRCLKSVIVIWTAAYILAVGNPGLADDDPIKIAAIFSITGIAAESNAPFIPMLQLGVEEINQNGGLLKRPVELIPLDNQSTPIGSTLAAEEAVRLNVIAVIGADWSSHSIAVAPVLQKAGIPMISPSSTNPDVTLAGDYIFRVCFLDSFQGRAMARFARSELKAQGVVIAKNIDEAYSLMLGEYFAKAFKENNGKILWEGDYRGSAVDFGDILAKIEAVKPDIVYVPGYARDSGLLIRQAAQRKVNATFLGGDGWDEIFSVAGDAVNGSYQTANWHPDVVYERSQHLKEIYHRKFGTAISSYNAPLAYDALMLLKEAIERAGSLDRSKIRQSIAATTEFKGATGTIRFNVNGDPTDKEVIILRLQNSTLHYVTALRP